MNEMNWLDITILIFIGYITYKNYKKGFTGVVFSLLSIFIAVISAAFFYPLLIPYVKKILGVTDAVEIISIILLLIGSYFFSLKIGEFLKKVLETIHLGWLNSLLGGLIGFMKGFIIVGIVLLLIVQLTGGYSKSKTIQNSTLTPKITYWFEKAFQSVKQTFFNNI